MNNDILVNRKIMAWGWYKDANTMRVFLHLLLNANWHDGEYRGKPILRGQCLFGRKAFAEDLGISEQSIRTSINHLISTNEITIKSTNKFSVITIVKYNDYQLSSLINSQENNQQINMPSTNNQPTTNHIQFSKSSNSVSQDITLLSSNEDNCCEQIRNEQSENKKKRKQPVFEHESKPYKLAAKLEEMIHTNNPDAKQQTETNLQSWAYEFDKAMRIDKRKARNIYDVMFYSQNDIFWKSNILSAKKLRQEYDRLKLQMEESSNDRRT